MNRDESRDTHSTAGVPPSVAAARALFFLNAVMWFVFGVFTLWRMARGSADQAATAGILAAMMAAYAVVLCFVGWSLGKRKRVFYYLAILVVLGTIVLTITDQFGIADFIALVLNVGLLALLVMTRRWYLSAA